MAPKKVVIVATSADTLANGEPTGAWAEELAAPYLHLREKGLDVTIASIQGGKIPIDAASLAPPFLTPEAEKFTKDEACMQLVNNSVAVKDLKADDYDALFLVGGHGTCVDFMGNEHLDRLMGTLFDAGKIVSGVCHGPNAFANAKSLATGEAIIKGRKITGFSNAEEEAVGKTDAVPFLLEDKLKELGGVYEKAGEPWGSHAVRDGNLITGQNPASSHAAAVLLAEALTA